MTIQYPLPDLPQWEMDLLAAQPVPEPCPCGTDEHPQPERERGWKGLPKAELDGKNWTLEFASKYLEVSESLLREVIKYTGLQPAGTLNMRPFRSQGRTPRAYPAGKLITIAGTLEALREDLAL